MTLARTLDEIRPFRGSVCVPTMGALHPGHAALIAAARGIAHQRRISAGVVVTVFVNPTQFNEAGDFARYPRDLERDVRAALAVGAGAVFAPAVELVYPPGVEIPVPPLPDVAAQPGLEDAFRPGHLAGVCQVVRRLFEMLEPIAAVFGEKDWQQLQTVRAMTKQQGLSVEIVGEPTVRESDGLAASSRNRLLDAPARTRALAIPRALTAAQPEATPADAKTTMRRVLDAASLDVEYAVVRDAHTLLPLAGADADVGGAGVSPARPARALIAARVAGVRLIDNAPWPALSDSTR